MIVPDYQGGSIVNLMATLVVARGGEAGLYPPLRALDPSALRRRNIVLLVIDGLGYQYLAAAGAGGALRRHLQGRITSTFPSTTATAITTYLTGTAPQQHGLTGWFTWFKEVGAVVAVLPFRPRHGGPGLAENGVSAAALYAHVPVFDRLRAQSYVVAPERIINSEYNVAHSGGAARRSYVSLAGMFRAIAQALGEGREQKYFYAYWPELDRLAHEHGIASPEVAAHLAELDAAFAQFLRAIAGSDTAVVVTADHGFIDTDPAHMVRLEDHPRLAETLVVPLCGEPRAAFCYVHPDQRARFEDYVRTRLGECATLHASADLIAQGWFGLGPPHPSLGERVGHYALVMKQNYVIKDWLLGERRYTHIGVHGGVSEQEMYVPLIVAQA